MYVAHPSFLFFSFLLFLAFFRQERKRRTKRKEKKRELGVSRGAGREEARSVRETGCGQLFTSWRMIPRGVPLQNESSSGGSTGKRGVVFRYACSTIWIGIRVLYGKNFSKELMDIIMYVQLLTRKFPLESSFYQHIWTLYERCKRRSASMITFGHISESVFKIFWCKLHQAHDWDFCLNTLCTRSVPLNLR